MPSASLFTKRLVLTPLVWGYPAMHDIHLFWLKDPEVLKYSEQRHNKHTKLSVKKYIQSFDHQKDLLYSIHLKEPAGLEREDRYIGNISVHRDIHNGTAEVGILLGEKKEWGKGYGAEAWQAVCDKLLANGTRKVEAGCMVTNVGMVKIFNRTGMNAEALIPDHFLFRGRPIPMVRAGRLKNGEV